MSNKHEIIYGAVRLRVHPAFAGITLDAGPWKALAATDNGRKLEKIMKSQTAVHSLVAAQIAAPSRPPLMALHRFLEAHLDADEIFTEEMKRLSGRYTRQVFEHLGFTFKRSGVPAVTKNPYGAGSIYKA